MTARDATAVALAARGARLVGVHGGEGKAVTLVARGDDGAPPAAPLAPTRRLALLAARARLAVRLGLALPRILYTLFRPYVLAAASLAVLVTLARRWREVLARRSRLYVLQWVVLLDVTVLNELRWIAADPVHRLDWLGHGANETQPGLYRARNFGRDPAQRRLTRILHRCGDDFADLVRYRAPRWMLHGDLRTVIPTISYRPRPLLYTRFCFPARRDTHLVTLDFAFPRDGDGGGDARSSPLILLMAGVGGDSNAPYMRDLVATCTSRGWTACVLLARGLGSSLQVPAVDKLFNPADTGDVLETLELLYEVCPDRPILLAGISMGAIALCNVLGRHAEAVPPTVMGCVAISGGFKCDMLHWPRYESVYQPLIVAKIAGEVVARYGKDFAAAGVDLDALVSSVTYTDLFRNFFAALPPPAGALDAGVFAGWKAAQEGAAHRHKIRVPLLLFAANDDPLHHPDLIGAETREYRFENPNVVYLLTGEGGHVGWPDSAWPSDFGIICNVTTQFLQAALDERRA